jgi:hypothetical protein
MDTKFGTWNTRSLYRANSFDSSCQRISEACYGLTRVREVRWDEDGTDIEAEYEFYLEMGMRKVN